MIKVYESVNSNDVYLNTHFNIDSGYKWGDGWAGVSEEDRFAFYDEIIHMFEDNGFVIREGMFSGSCPTAVKPGTEERLYLHPMELTGPVLENDIPKIERFLKGAETFELISVKTYGELVPMNDAEYEDYLEDHRDEIIQDILDEIGTEKYVHYDFFDSNNKVYNKWHLDRTGSHTGKSSLDVDLVFLSDLLYDLIADGIIDKNSNLKYKVVK